MNKHIVIFCPKCGDIITVPLELPEGISMQLKALEAPNSVNCKRYNIKINLISRYSVINPEIPQIIIKDWEDAN